MKLATREKGKKLELKLKYLVHKMFRLVECHCVVPDEHEVGDGLGLADVHPVLDVLTNCAQVHRLFDHLKRAKVD